MAASTKGRAPEGQRRAFVTFLIRNDSYLPGALVLAHGLRRQRTTADLVCLVTPVITRRAREALGLLYDRVIETSTLFVPHLRRQERQDRPYWFTRLNALRLGPDGDLGCRYRKVVVLDADVLPLARYDRLFDLSVPAGVINERRSHFLECDERGKYLVPVAAGKTGRWCWHRIYGDVCPHGHAIPAGITDRVRRDPSNMGVHGALLVLATSMAEFRSIRRDLRRPSVRRLVSDAFTWPDMQYLTMRWSGLWISVDARFCGLNGYPTPAMLFGTHFAGVKPWSPRRPRALRRLLRFPDHALWFERFRELVTREHLRLLRIGRLRRLLATVDAG